MTVERALALDRKFGQRLRQKRMRQGLTQAQLAARAGFTIHLVWRIENAKTTRQATVGEAVQLAKALGVQVSELIR